MTFIRFLNQISKKKFKYVGFEVIANKKNIFNIMLQSLADLTLPKSSCQLFYKNYQGKVIAKIFRKHTINKFYINGFIYQQKEDKLMQSISKKQKFDHIFKVVSEK